MSTKVGTLLSVLLLAPFGVAQGVILDPKPEKGTAAPGCLPQPRPDAGPPVAGLDLPSARLCDVLEALAQRDNVPVLAEVYPGTKWDGARHFAAPDSPHLSQLLGLVAEAYDCEWGEVAGVSVFRKNRPWEQPAMPDTAPEGELVAVRRVSNGQGLEDVVAELRCDAARLATVLGRLSAWRTDDVPLHLRRSGVAYGFLVSPDFASRRLFARVAGLPTSHLTSVVAACVGASPEILPPNVLFLRSPGMAWRAAVARYAEGGRPDFGKLLSGDTALLSALEPPAKLVLFSEVCRGVSLPEVRRMRQGPAPAAVLESLKGEPYEAWVLQQRDTVSVPFEGLSALAQSAFIAALEDHEKRFPDERADRGRPEAMYVTLRIGVNDTHAGSLACCRMTYPSVRGPLVTF
jgi:hypothetical protein